MAGTDLHDEQSGRSPSGLAADGPAAQGHPAVPEDALPLDVPVDTSSPPTRIGRLIVRAQDLQARVTKQLEEALKVMPALDLVWETSRRFRRLNGSVLAGHLAYRMFLWFFPFVLVVVGLLGYSASSGIRLASYVDDAGGSASFTTTVADQAQDQRLYVLVVGAFGLAWATAGIIRALHYIYSQAWELPIAPRRRIVQATGKVLVGIVVATTVLFVLGLSRGQGPLLRVSGATATFFTQTALVTVVMLFLPRRTRSVLDLLPGAALFATCMLLLQLFAQYYLPEKAASSSELYGALGAALGIMFYLWCISTLLVSAAFVNAVWFDRGVILADRPWVADPDRLPRWARSAWDRGAAVSDRVGDRVGVAAGRLQGEVDRRFGGAGDDVAPADQGTDETAAHGPPSAS